MDAHKEKDKRAGGPLKGHSARVRIVIVVMVILLAAASLLFARSLRGQLYEQRAFSLGQTTEKIVQVMNTVINNEWDRLTYASHELSREPQTTQAQLLARLADFYGIDSMMHSWKLSCIDSQGLVYRWDGQVERWYAPDMLISGRSDYQIAIREARDTDEEQMLFLYRLAEPIALTDEDVVLTHTLLTLDMASFGESLEVSAFEGSSFSYITEQNGTRLYHQENQSEFMAAYNILTALQNTRFLYDTSYEALIAASDAGELYSAEIERDGGRYFVACAPLSVNDWSLFLFVPEANVGGDTAHFVNRLLAQVTAIALLALLVISSFVWSNSRQTVARQQLAVDEAHRASQAKSDFLSHMSHDMRTPLNGIMGMCHIAQQNTGDEAAVADCLDKIDLSSRQLLSLINDVLDMSRIEQDKVEAEHVPVDLRELVRTCTVHIEAAVYEKGIAFRQDISGIEHPYVSADPVLIEKILTNLLGNASKFTPPGGEICLEVTESGAQPGQGLYRFRVADTGVGMQPEFLAHLFEPFSQERTGSRTKYQGTGLGLSIVKSLTDRLGGDVAVESTPGAGSSFTVSLPLAQLDSSAFPAEETAPAPFNGAGLRALLAEDNDLNRLIAQKILEECGLTVDAVVDGAQALERFAASQPGDYDIIFMDLRMPVMDGLEASRRIRALERADAAGVPIIALTADALSGDAEKTRQAGMNAHLGKPIELDKLYAVLSRYGHKDEVQP